jgi:hypothetical protein
MAAIAASTSTFAQSQPTPRQPLSPGDLGRQFPAGVQSQAPTAGADSITVTNLGNTTLSFSAWDGTASWKPFQLGSGQTVTISCAQCGSEIPVAFHDGTQTRTISAKTADSYGLFWNFSHSRWDFASTATITGSRGQSR